METMMEENALLDTARRAADSAVTLRAIGRTDIAIRLDDLAQELAFEVSALRRARVLESEMGNEASGTGTIPAIAEGTPDLEGVREESTLPDRLRGFLGSAG